MHSSRVVPCARATVKGLCPFRERWFDERVSAELTSTQPRTTRSLSVAQQTKLRTRLIAELQELRDLQERIRLEIADGIATRRGAQNDETDDPEGSNLAFEGLQSAAMLQQTTRHVEEISAALARLDAGSYGTCIECDGEIARGRLEARPSTAHCIGCAS